MPFAQIARTSFQRRLVNADCTLNREEEEEEAEEEENERERERREREEEEGEEERGNGRRYGFIVLRFVAEPGSLVFARDGATRFAFFHRHRVWQFKESEACSPTSLATRRSNACRTPSFLILLQFIHGMSAAMSPVACMRGVEHFALVAVVD